MIQWTIFVKGTVIMKKEEKAILAVNALKKEYPEALCSLNAGNEFELLVATRLSAQCTDARVNVVTPELFSKYKTLEDYASADLADVEAIVRPCGFYHNKAKDIIGMAQMIIERFGGKVPDNIEDLTTLPGVGRKTALRLALYMLRREPVYTESFASALLSLRREVKYCKVCHNICDDELCAICSDPRRDQSTVCVVENVKEVMAVENTGQFQGVYHVLGGILSPVDGIGPSDLQLDSLVQRVATGEVKEVILALSTTMEGETTNFFIYRKLQPYDVKVTVIARGVSIGDEIEYADEITLGRSIVNRTNFNDSLKM